MDTLRASLPKDLLKAEAEKEGAEKKRKRGSSGTTMGKKLLCQQIGIPRHCGSKHRVHNPDVSPYGRGQLAAAGIQQVCTHTMGQEKRLEEWHTQGDTCMRRG